MDNNNLFDVSLIFTPFLSHPTSWAYPKIVGLFVRSHFQTGISSMVLPERGVMALSSSNVMTIIFSRG